MFLNTLCLYLGNLLWQVCITSLVWWRETSVSLRLWEHNTWFLLHHISLIITLSVRTNQHRHKMLDILPSRPLDVRTQLASSPSPLPCNPDHIVTEVCKELQTAPCLVSPVLSPALLTPHLTCPAWLRHQADQGWTLIHFTTTSAGREFSEDDSTIVLYPINPSIHTLKISSSSHKGNLLQHLLFINLLIKVPLDICRYIQINAIWMTGQTLWRLSVLP